MNHQSAITTIRLRNGKEVRRVSEQKYKRYEQIRNYVLRLNYERGVSISMATFKAMCYFKITERDVDIALKEWKKWFYGEGIRHRPIELFIQDEKERSLGTEK